MKTYIKDITGAQIEVTDLKTAIEQCRICRDSRFKMASGHTIGENHRFMLEQLMKLQQDQRRANWLPGTKEKHEKGKRFTKDDMGYEIGRHDPHHPASIYWDTYKREEMVYFFNKMFGTDIK